MAGLDQWPLMLLVLSAVWLLCYYHLYCARRRSLRGLTILITGCDTGLGRHAALHLSSHGMVVYAGCLTPAAVTSLTSLSHPSLHPFLLDVTSPTSVSTALHRLSPFLLPHGLDCLLNNAGVFDGFLTELTPVTTYERCMQVNFIGAIRVTQAFLPLIRHAQGRVVTVGSFLGFSSAWGLSAYAATKHALEAWHDAVRGELSPFGVQCSLVQPGAMRTALLQSVVSSYLQLWDAGDEEVKAAYGEETLQVLPRVQLIMQQLSADTAGVVRVIANSLRSEHSSSRYRVGWDCWLQWLAKMAPISDHAMDSLLAWTVSQPQPAAMRKAKHVS